MNMNPLLEYCEQHLDDTVRRIETLVRLESPSTDKAAVDRCGAELARMLRAVGADVEILPQPERGDHLRARS
jgi:glutamate carboxypeptidase